jgi:hypothetical protein
MVSVSTTTAAASTTSSTSASRITTTTITTTTRTTTMTITTRTSIRPPYMSTTEDLHGFCSVFGHSLILSILCTAQRASSSVSESPIPHRTKRPLPISMEIKVENKRKCYSKERASVSSGCFLERQKNAGGIEV